MAAGRDALTGYVRQLAIGQDSRQASDAALLERFVAERNEAAFAALVERHGPLVFHVCRRILGDVEDAEDAFQVTFLVLARRAAAVHPREALAAWLHGVALRVAFKARSARTRRVHGDLLATAPPVDPRPDPLAGLSARELLALVDDEVRRLPRAYRLAVILCCLEGHSLEEAAQQLGWTLASLKGRLRRGRARLRDRLARRGLPLSAALAVAELTRSADSVAAVARLADPTVRAAVGFAIDRTAAGEASARIAILAGQVLRSMALARLRFPAVLVLATCLLAAGLVSRQATDPPLAMPPAVRSSSFPFQDRGQHLALGPVAQDTAEGTPQRAADSVEVSGSVLDPAGRPFGGARLYVGYAPRRYEPDAIAHEPVYPLRATSGPDGQFAFAFARSLLDERYLDASRPVVIAVADGFGMDWAEVAEPVGLTLKLAAELPVEGRIVDRDGNPVTGAKIVVREVSGGTGAGLTQYLQSGDRGSLKSCRGPLPGQTPHVTTGSDGRFRLSGLGRDRLVALALEGSAFPITVATLPGAAIRPSPGVYGAAFVHTIGASQSIRGVVRDKRTGQPMAGVRVSVETTGPATLTTPDGRYELLRCPGSQESIVMAQPQAGEPFFAAALRVTDEAGIDSVTVDFDLVGGIPLSGRVTDRNTGKPPKRAVVEYYPLFPNAHGAALTNCTRLMPASSTPVRPDGSYSLPVLPGPGIALVAASPRDSYAVALLDDNELAGLFGDGVNHGGGSWVRIAVGGRAWPRCVDRYNALSLIKPNPAAESVSLDLSVQPAIGLRGRVLGPGGEPLTGVRVSGLTSMPDAETLGSPSFTVERLNPRRTRDLFFHDRDRDLGKVVTVRGDQTEPLAVQLEPCGWVVGRLVDKRGRPVPAVAVSLSPGSYGMEVWAQTDEHGRFRAALVAGPKYVLGLSSPRHLLSRVGAVEVESDRSHDLGNLILDD
jgi:RNA polymerase sigma factor (sigma-70 family)